MNKNIGKILIALGILVAVIAVYRGFFYYNNDAVDLPGAQVNGASVGMVAGASTSASPRRLIIPALNIDANVQSLGITKKGNMAAPSNFTDVSWYKYGTVPGNTGSAVMAGHEDNAVSLDGVFKHLDNLQIDDDVYVQDMNGDKLHFRVVEKEVYPYNLSGAELTRVFNGKGGAYLNLITCTGHWVEAIKTNNQRLVVFTELVK